MVIRQFTWLSLILTGLVAACSPITVDVTGNNNSNTTTKTQALSAPNYPVMYDVEIKVCGNIIAPLKDGKRCIQQKPRLWGPIGEVKLIPAGIALPSVSAVDHKLAIASKGCYPAYSKPSQQQFYWLDVIIPVNKTAPKPTMEIKKNQLSNQQIDELVKSNFTRRTISTFGGVGCEPAAVK
jgi:hypothetical protein